MYAIIFLCIVHLKPCLIRMALVQGDRNKIQQCFLMGYVPWLKFSPGFLI